MHIPFIKDEKFLEKYNEINSNIIKKECESKHLYNEKSVETKTKSYNGKVNTIFHDVKTPKEGSHFIFLSVILNDSVYRKDRIYCPQVFLEEYKYVAIEKKLPRFITDSIKISSDDFSSLENSLLKYKKFLKLEAGNFHLTFS